MTINITIDQIISKLDPEREYTPISIAKKIGLTRQRVTGLCAEGQFWFYDNDGSYQDGAYRMGRMWRIKGSGVIAYLERMNE